MDWNTRDVSGDSEAMLSFFGCSKFSVWVCNTSDVHTGQTFTISWSKTQLSWMLMLYYPYKTMFSVYKSVIVSPCACDLFVSKVTKITRYMDVRFWRSFFGFFSVWWLYLEINQNLVAEIICTIYSFIHASTQYNILNKNCFQQCFIFNWSAYPLACAPFGTKSYTNTCVSWNGWDMYSTSQFSPFNCYFSAFCSMKIEKGAYPENFNFVFHDIN